MSFIRGEGIGETVDGDFIPWNADASAPLTKEQVWNSFWLGETSLAFFMYWQMRVISSVKRRGFGSQD